MHHQHCGRDHRRRHNRHLHSAVGPRCSIGREELAHNTGGRLSRRRVAQAGCDEQAVFTDGAGGRHSAGEIGVCTGGG
eukprot:scaffold4817_cov116-Isochrysis_galbana.AAC.1